MKDDIELVGEYPNGLNMYEFSYKVDRDKRRYRGVMADEVLGAFPDAVVYDDSGFAGVRYDMLGIEMVRV